ncbi:MAG: hypothetical protein WCQ60_00550 [bacterium]
MIKEYPTKSTSVHENLKDKSWFSGLLDDVNLSTTYYIGERAPDVTFKLLEQEKSDSFVVRRIGFFIGEQMICEAANKVTRNELVDVWIEKNQDKPFGEVFKNRNLHRVLISKTENSRKFDVSGDIQAEIEEKFYPLV